MINVLYPFDNNYAPYAGISITSLLMNNQHADEINVFILGFNLSEENIVLLRKTVEQYDRNIFFIDGTDVSRRIDELQLPSYRGASVAAARLFISDFLADFDGRIIYLDSDTLIVGDLEELMSEELSGCAVGMSLDSVGRDSKCNIGIKCEEPYYNAGVILYDLKIWKEKKCTERIVEHIQNVRSNYEALDQDLINKSIGEDIKTLSPRYNLQPFHVCFSSREYKRAYGLIGYYNEVEIQEAVESPVIYHCFRYINTFPWHLNSIHPHKYMFEQYKQQSFWGDLVEKDADLSATSTRVQLFIYHHFSKLMYLRFFRAAFKRASRRNNKRLVQKCAYKNI